MLELLLEPGKLRFVLLSGAVHAPGLDRHCALAGLAEALRCLDQHLFAVVSVPGCGHDRSDPPSLVRRGPGKGLGQLQLALVLAARAVLVPQLLGHRLAAHLALPQEGLILHHDEHHVVNLVLTRWWARATG